MARIESLALKLFQTEISDVSVGFFGSPLCGATLWLKEWEVEGENLSQSRLHPSPWQRNIESYRIVFRPLRLMSFCTV